MEKARVLIADDHKIVIEGVKSALRQYGEFEVVGEASNGREAVGLVQSLHPSLVIMDVAMPDLNGIEATLQIKKIDPTVGIIIFTMYSDREYVVELFKAGVSAYLLKEDPLSDLVRAVRAVQEGGTYFNPTVERMIAEYDSSSGYRGTASDSAFDNLSLREREVFQLLAEGKSIKETAVVLGLSPKTVETHKYKIMRKLNACCLSDLTRLAIKRKVIQP